MVSVVNDKRKTENISFRLADQAVSRTSGIFMKTNIAVLLFVFSLSYV
jgi:hypothetical protein